MAMKNRKIKRPVWAVLLVLVGVLLLLTTLDVITMKDSLYLYIVLAGIGVVFHVSCFISTPPKYQLLVPGGILISMAAFLIICDYSDKFSATDYWPIIILCIAFGMLEQKVLSRGAQGSWSSVLVLTLVGIFFLIQESLSFGVAVSIVLIVAGIAMFVTSIKNSSKPKKAPENKKTSYELDDDEL